MVHTMLVQHASCEARIKEPGYRVQEPTIRVLSLASDDLKSSPVKSSDLTPSPVKSSEDLCPLLQLGPR